MLLCVLSGQVCRLNLEGKLGSFMHLLLLERLLRHLHALLLMLMLLLQLLLQGVTLVLRILMPNLMLLLFSSLPWLIIILVVMQQHLLLLFLQLSLLMLLILLLHYRRQEGMHGRLACSHFMHLFHWPVEAVHPIVIRICTTFLFIPAHQPPQWHSCNGNAVHATWLVLLPMLLLLLRVVVVVVLLHTSG